MISRWLFLPVRLVSGIIVMIVCLILAAVFSIADRSFKGVGDLLVGTLEDTWKFIKG